MQVLIPELSSGGHRVDVSEGQFGWLRDSNDLLTDVAALRDRMDRDGYLFLPGFLDRDKVAEARRTVCQALQSENLLDPDFPVDAAIAKPDLEMYFRADIANGFAKAEIDLIIYGDKIMAFFSELFGTESMHYDYTWMRTVAPGKGTFPHCDVVYMGRGTQNVYTAWVPLGDVPLHVGGLVLMEGSNHDSRLRDTYCQLDVDTSCQNDPEKNQLGAAGYPGYGAISTDMPSLRADLGYRMLTAEEYRMGDILIFSIFTVHGSLDNASREIRMSTDSRYQPANEPADERWIGEHPPGHGGDMIKGLIC